MTTDTSATSDIEVELFTDLTQLEKNFAKLHAGAVITKDEYISDVPGYINDLEWNFYDEIHRFYVHNTYHDMFKVFSGKTFSVNLVKWGKWPIFIQVANAKVASNLFYQSMTILGILYIHQIMSLEQVGRNVRLTRRWYIISHWLFKPLHKALNRTLMKLQVKQDIEDNEHIRGRRLDLRDAGYCFTTDKPDFTNSNQLTNNVIFPPSEAESRISLNSFSSDEVQSVKIGILELLVKREGAHIRIWPAICAHEGALMKPEHVCEGVAQCPWHGRRFKGAQLEEGGMSWQFMDFEVSLANATLIVRRVKTAQVKVA